MEAIGQAIAVLIYCKVAKVIIKMFPEDKVKAIFRKVVTWVKDNKDKVNVSDITNKVTKWINE